MQHGKTPRFHRRREALQAPDTHCLPAPGRWGPSLAADCPAACSYEADRIPNHRAPAMAMRREECPAPSIQGTPSNQLLKGHHPVPSRSPLVPLHVSVPPPANRVRAPSAGNAMGAAKTMTLPGQGWALHLRSVSPRGLRLQILGPSRGRDKPRIQRLDPPSAAASRTSPVVSTKRSNANA